MLHADLPCSKGISETHKWVWITSRSMDAWTNSRLASDSGTWRIKKHFCCVDTNQWSLKYIIPIKHTQVSFKQRQNNNKTILIINL
jgi:hypothetical protein